MVLTITDVRNPGLAVATASGDRDAEPAILTDLGLTLRMSGQRSASVETSQRALELATKISHPYEQARALTAIGDLLELDDPAEARLHWERALVLFRRMGVPDSVEVERRIEAGRLAGSGGR